MPERIKIKECEPLIMEIGRLHKRDFVEYASSVWIVTGRDGDQTTILKLDGMGQIETSLKNSQRVKRVQLTKAIFRRMTG